MADVVRCDACDAIVYVWPKRLSGQCFTAAAERLGRHLEMAHGVHVEGIEHGTENAYANLRCRCARCREAHRVYEAARRDRHPEINRHTGRRYAPPSPAVLAGKPETHR